MDKKGFTIVELLAVIVILAIILTITVPSIANILYTIRLNSFAADEKMMVWSTKNYMSLNGKYLPNNIGETVEVKLGDLQSKELINNIQNPWDSNDTCDGYILVTKVGANAYDYTPYLKCENNYKADSYITDGLVAYWKLDGNAYDYTPNGNQGTIQKATVTTNRLGVSNKALSFNGPSNFIDTSYDYSLNYDGGATFSIWVKFSMLNTDGKVKNIFGKNSWEYILSQIDNKIYFTAWNSDGSYAARLTSNTNIQIDRWYNIVVVYNGQNKQAYLYIDGALDTYSYISGDSFANKNESLKIGRGYPDIGAASSTFFVGAIDNLCIYSRAWSADEVKLNYDISNYIGM